MIHINDLVQIHSKLFHNLDIMTTQGLDFMKKQSAMVCLKKTLSSSPSYLSSMAASQTRLAASRRLLVRCVQRPITLWTQQMLNFCLILFAFRMRRVVGTLPRRKKYNKISFKMSAKVPRRKKYNKISFKMSAKEWSFCSCFSMLTLYMLNF